MKNTSGRKWAHLILLVAALSSAGTWAAGKVRSTQDRSEVAAMAAKKPGIPGMFGRTFIDGRSRDYMMDWDRRVYLQPVSVESHAHTNGLSLSLMAHSAEESSAKEAEAIFAWVQLRGGNAIPTAPGFCVSHGVFVDPLPVHKSEQMLIHLALPGHDDLSVTFASIAGARPGPGLLARTAETDATMSADLLVHMSKLRAGKRIINGVDGEEVLLRAHEFNFTTTYGFSWEAGGSADDTFLPFLSLELRSGGAHRPGGRPVDSSLHQDALLELWDSIASSLRRRTNERRPAAPQRDRSKFRAVAATERNEI